MARLVIFDLDGTLLDTVEDLGNATNYALRMCGFPERPLQDYYQLVGRGIYNLFRQAMPVSDEAMAQASDEAMVQKMASYFSHITANICATARSRIRGFRRCCAN